MATKLPAARKPVIFIGTSRDDLRAMPDDVMDTFGFALDDAALGGKSRHAKVLQGFGGAGVLEVVDDYQGDTYRAVYTVKFTEAVYVLHAFQKKSRKGIETPKADMDKITARLKLAKAHHKENFEKKKTG